MTDERCRLSILVPTVGRASLSATLASITGQLHPGDECIVQRDDSGDWGATARNKMMAGAQGSHLLFMDDDDVYLPDGLAVVRRALQRDPDRPHLFRMRRGAPCHDTFPPSGTTAVECGLVSTQIFVCPNVKARLGQWSQRYECDYDFVASTLALYPEGSMVRHDDIIALWRQADFLDVESICGWMTPVELEALAQIVRGENPLKIVEIGSWCGRSAAQFYLRCPVGSSLACVDCYSDYEGYYKPLLTQGIDPKANLLFNMETCARLRPDVAWSLLEKKSLIATESFAPGSLDVVFIDGDHSYNAVFADIVAWRSKVKVGGILCGHDYAATTNPDVVRAVNELVPNVEILPKTTIWVARMQEV